MKDSRKELTVETMEKVAGGGWEQLIPYALQIVDSFMSDSSSGDNGAPSNSSPGSYNQNNSNNSGVQQNTQNGPNSNDGGMTVTKTQQQPA